MNKKIYILGAIVLVLLCVVLVFVATRTNLTPENDAQDDLVAVVPEKVNSKELCFAHFGLANESGFSDKYILRMVLDNSNGKVTGEYKYLPAEKDSRTGNFEGTVSAVDKIMMARKVDAIWNARGEGMENKEELKFTFGEGTADIFGSILTDVACSDLVLRTNIENYLRVNIAKLSPAKAVLGGTWNYIDSTIDTSKNSGIVVYEDGHVQEKKNFTFTANEKYEVVSLTILK